MSTEADREPKPAAFERMTLDLVLQQLRSAIETIEGGGASPSDAVITDAGVLATDAATLLEALYEGRLEVRGRDPSSIEDGKKKEDANDG